MQAQHEIGRVVFRFQSGIVEIVLTGLGDWLAPPRLREFLRAACPPGRHVPSDGPWGWQQLRRAAELLGGTAVPLREGGASASECDGQASPPVGAQFSHDTTAVPDGVIKIDAPSLEQNDDYSCGAVLLEAFARHFDVAPDDNDVNVREWFKRKLGTTRSGGTPPPRMEMLARDLGLHPEIRHPMSDDELRESLDAGRPVVCCLQAWGTPAEYDRDESGHYVGAIGYDERNVYFEDSMIRRARGYMGWSQFGERWHDKGADGTPYRRWGMSLWRPDEPAREIE